MNSQTEQILDAAVQLPASERIALTDALLDSIPLQADIQAAIDPETGQAWGREIERRIAAAADGKAKMISAEDAKPGHSDA